MPKKQAEPLTLEPDYHPFRATFRLPDLVLNGGWVTFDSPEGKAPHPGAAALLQIPGVNSVTLHRNQVTLLRDLDGDWDSILPAAREVLTREFLGRDAFELPEEGGEADSEAAPAEAGP